MTAYGKLLREAREQVQISLRRVSEKVGVSSAYMSRIETSDEVTPPTASMICKLCELYQISPYPVLCAAKRMPDEVIQYIADHPDLLKVLHQAARGQIEPNGALFELLTSNPLENS